MPDIAYSKYAIRALRRMPADQRALVVSKIEQYAAEPQTLAANVKKLQGRPGYRLRVGDWRVIFERQGDVLTIVDIGPRGGIYKE